MDREMVASGLTQVAVGTLTGWPLAAAVAQPRLAAQVGIRDASRLRQAHLDVIIMGGLTAAAGLVDRSPRWAKSAIRIGAWTNPALFLPLAFKPNATKSASYMAASAVSFTITCAGWIGIARAARAARAQG